MPQLSHGVSPGRLLRLRERPAPGAPGTGATLSVLDITKFFGDTTGGIRTYLLEKTDYVRAHGDLRQIIVVPGDHDSSEPAGRIRWYRVRGPRIPTQHPYRFLLRAGAVRRIVEQERPDVIEVGSPYLVPWIARRAARATNTPLVWFFHTNFPRIISPRPDRDSRGRRLLGRMAAGYVRRLAGVFDAAVGASEVAVRELERAGFARVEKIPLGVSLEHFHPRRRQSAGETRKARGLPDAPLAIFAGRLAREKELDLVIDAWPRVEAETGAHLVLVGDGPSRAYFEARCRARQVSWFPYETDRNRLADLLAACDLYLAPGPAETFGLAALEAMASGLPVVSSDQGAVRELVEASGAGIVNPEPDSGAMAESIIQLLSQDLGALGDRARRYAEVHHEWDVVFNRLFAFYREILAGRHA
jgi:alpha-1,6-mannosyltransferase